MNYPKSLPEPSSDALAHSQKLVGKIRNEIDANSGSISFRRYMEMALYEPALGYYVSGLHKIGSQGDFVTAPEISPLFSLCLAEQCKEILSTLKDDTPEVDILELGAGSGAMAATILKELERQNSLPESYYILDLSPDLKQRQKETIDKHVPHLLERVKWISKLPENFIGVILGNEVLDAMPVDIFTQQNEVIYEHHVIWKENKLVEELQPANERLNKKVLSLDISHKATPYTSEVNPNLNAWFDALSKSMDKGVVILADYGYTEAEYYLEERNKGTLICHYQHLVNEAPLSYSGLQDITSNVDFTAVAKSADKAGFDVSGYITQANFLTNAELESFFMNSFQETPSEQFQLSQQVRKLSLPSEMGERFKFIGLSKAYKKSLKGFSQMDLRHKL